MRRALAAAVLLLATGCGSGSGSGRDHSDAVGHADLKAICPGAHQVYDALVASNPESQTVFVDRLQSLRESADAEARAALDPLVKGAQQLAAAGRGPDFSAAQDAMYAGVVDLDKACRAAGSFILH